MSLESTALLASVLGRQLGIKVTANGSDAYSSDGLINIPAVADPVLAAAYVDHECGHLRHTAWGVVKQNAANRQLSMLANIFEDVRIEALMRDHYPSGTVARNLRHAEDTLINIPTPDDASGEQVIFDWILKTARGCPQHLPAIPAALASKLTVVIRKAVCTQDAYDIAEDVLKILQSQASQQSQQSQAAQGQASQDDGQQSPASQAGGQQQAAQNFDIRKFNPDNIDTHELSTHTRPDLRRAGRGSRKLTVEKMEYRQNHNLSRMNSVLLREADLQTARLRAILQQRLQALARGFRTGRNGRRVDGRSCWRLAVADPRVFYTEHDCVKFNTAVYILADGSGSMQGDPQRCQSQAVYALQAALKFPGIYTECWAFSGEELTQVPYKYFTPATSCTPLGAATACMLTRLVARPETKKVLIVLTDGDADDPYAFELHLQAAVKAGIQVIGVGIQHDTPCTNGIVIDNIRDLPCRLMSLTDRII